MSNTNLSHITNQIKKGELLESKQELHKIVLEDNKCYVAHANLSALYLQEKDHQSAIDHASRAILIDPFSHIAYYNKFLCLFQMRSYEQAWNCLRKALSCIFLERGAAEKNIKYVNKAINFNEHNIKAYLVRAKLNESKNNIKLVENDYLAATQYAPNFRQIYLMRAIFYRSIGKIDKFEEDLQQYNKLNQQNSEQMPNPQKPEEINDYYQMIKEEVSEYIQAISRKKASKPQIQKQNKQVTQINHEQIDKLPLASLQSKFEQQYQQNDDEMLLSDRPEQTPPSSTQTIQIKKQGINFINKQVDEIFNDGQDSNQLNSQIQKLEREIKAQGGKIPSGEDSIEEKAEDNSNFLSQQLQKAINQIENIKDKETLQDVRSIKSFTSLTSQGSQLGEIKQISSEQFQSHKKILLQIVSLQLVEDPSKKETAKVCVKYNGNQKGQTSMQQFLWGQKFDIEVVPGCYEVEVQVMKKGSLIFWGNTQIAKGVINLLQQGNTRSILENQNSKKVAKLHYILKLE